MKLFEFGVQSAVVAPALAANLSGAAVPRTGEPMADQAFIARVPRIRFAPAASVIGSGHRIRLR